MFGGAVVPDGLGGLRIDGAGPLAFPVQRTAGVASVAAATPAGNGVYSVMDIHADEAWALAEELTPGITDVWFHEDDNDAVGAVSPSMGVRRPG